jgi:hypothetical protein
LLALFDFLKKGNKKNGRLDERLEREFTAANEHFGHCYEADASDPQAEPI